MLAMRLGGHVRNTEMYWLRGKDWYDGRVGIYERGITMLERAVRARWSSRIKQVL